MALNVIDRTLKAVLVDDEELARGYLRELLAPHPEILVVAECANGFEAVKAIAETSPDLLFLDVQMPKLDGFEVLELIEPAQAPVVVFVTAYDQYAMRAFDAHAVDYLLKPFSAERFERALERARARLGERRVPPDLAPEARAPGERPLRIVVKDGTRVHVIPIARLDYVAAQDDYVALHSEGKSYLKQQPIAALEALLDPACFVRIHRSAIVNLERVARIEPYGKESRIAILNDGTRLPVSRSGLRAAAGSDGRFAGESQLHAVNALAPSGLHARGIAIAQLQPAPHVGQSHAEPVGRAARPRRSRSPPPRARCRPGAPRTGAPRRPPPGPRSHA